MKKKLFENMGGNTFKFIQNENQQQPIKLITIGRNLHTPFNVASDEFKSYSLEDEDEKDGFILADHDNSGDVITGRWPLNSEEGKKNLAILLYGARETGQIPSDTVSVILPDNSEFTIDQ